MVSAVVDTQVVRRALENGVNDFIHKPFSFVELQTCVSEAICGTSSSGQKTLMRTRQLCVSESRCVTTQ